MSAAAAEQAKLRKRLEALLKLPENQMCCDCGKRGEDQIPHAYLIYLFLLYECNVERASDRAPLGFSQPRKLLLHRVLWHTQKPRSAY